MNDSLMPDRKGSVASIGHGSSARSYSFKNLDAFYDAASERQWTDGLPVVPPTPDRVAAMVAAAGRDPLECIAILPPKLGQATVERIAINAVMAGCKPNSMRIILAAVEAIAQPDFDIYGVQATTHPCGIMVLISGPIAKSVGINGGGGCFGPGFPANASIGRAIRLILMNIGGGRPQETDMATQASPAKFSFCFTENIDASPWEPFHVAKGFSPDSSTVTVAAAEAPHNISDHVSAEPRGVLYTIAQTIASIGTNNAYLHNSDYFVVLCPEHASLLGRFGWSRRDVQEYLFERARLPFRVWRQGGLYGMIPQHRYLDAADDDLLVPMSGRADDINVLVAGGGGRHSSWIPTFAKNCRSVTVQLVDGAQ
jgi:hypothetical protein